MRSLILILMPALLSLACGAATAADPPEAPAGAGSGFYSRINLLGFGLYQDTRANNLANPGNRLEIPRYQAELNLRPDFNLDAGRFEFGLKPRLRIARTKVEHRFGREVNDTVDEAFINEGFVRFRLTDSVLLNAGRENLQWGPSALLSPSNPFNASNGRNNPNLELPGLDYARAVFVASPSVTVSAIANTGAGRLEHAGPYRKAYAAKLDYTGDGHFASVLVSRRDGDSYRIGGFAGWNASDALLLYAEGSTGEDSGARRDRQLLAGGAYTLESGATLTGELFVNNAGCPDAHIATCIQMRGVLVDALHPLVRRRYAMLQYADTKIGGNVNLVVRLIRNLDDRSVQLVANAEYELGEHWQLYLIPTFYHGQERSEFGALLRKSVFFGASYTF
ncbi:hypothetical protein [Massilia cavernae]|uniref:Porin n=1 Tax=Massilia cavernae TaxID=2320864 RepID=A0A418XB66_9BURK|nr:hypothetical protein [Massilia cavernae]RJG09583.1 hypothetical protein D3872_21980 [Massilia cavernae]